MRLGNLPAEHETDARAAAFGGKKGHEEVGRIREAGAFIADNNLQRACGVRVPDEDAAAGLLCGIDGVANQVDQDLFELCCIGLDDERGTGYKGDGHARFEIDHAADEPIDFDWRQLGRGQFGQPRVRVQKAAERFGAGGDHM